jgi:osmotically-inducible protein OsmY
MKGFIIGLLAGVIIGAGVYWFFTAERPAEQVQKARETAHETAEQAKQALAAKMEALELSTEDIRKELAEKGRVVRRKARDIGKAATDAAVDARVTAAIKTKLAADPDLSALSISVSTTAGRVTLSGTVASYDLIGKAMALALDTEGVREVVSTLQVG